MSFKVIANNNVTSGCSLEVAKELIKFFDSVGVDAYAVPELYFSDEFDVVFFHNLIDSELKEYIDFSSYDEILDFHVVDYCDYFDDDEE